MLEYKYVSRVSGHSASLLIDDDKIRTYQDDGILPGTAGINFLSKLQKTFARVPRKLVDPIVHENFKIYARAYQDDESAQG